MAVEYGILKMPAKCPLSECLNRLSREITEIVKRTEPRAAVFEGIFFCKNVKTAVTLGEARGAVIAACAACGLPIYEYAPRRVKQAVVGFGSAGKVQVQKMVATLLGLKSEPREDESDALALAICHLHSRTAPAVFMPKEI